MFSSVQFAKINVVLSDTVISVIDAVVAGKENVLRSRRNEDKDGAEVTPWAVARSTIELL